MSAPTYRLTRSERSFLRDLADGWQPVSVTPDPDTGVIVLAPDIPDSSLRALRQCGLIEQAGGGWRITPEGRRALAEAAEGMKRDG